MKNVASWEERLTRIGVQRASVKLIVVIVVVVVVVEVGVAVVVVKTAIIHNS